MRQLAMAAVVLCLGSGCAVGTKTLRAISVDQLPETATNAVVSPRVESAPVNPQQVQAESAEGAAYADETPACEVRLLAQQLASPKYQGIADGSLGAFFVERMPGTAIKPRANDQGQGNVFGGVCVKRVGQPLQLPEDIMIATDPEGPDLERFCQEDPLWYALVPPKPTTLAVTWVRACAWNGTFHSSRPFTFTLMTRDDTTVAEFVEAFRVYRNGDLMAAWNHASDTPNPHKVVLEGKRLITGAFAATQPPHMAAMDLRVLPYEKSVSHEVQMEVRDDRARFLARVSTASKAAAKVALPPRS